MKFFFLFSIVLIVLNSCFKAKRSPYDTSTPSGGALTYLRALSLPSSAPAEESLITLPKNRIRFVAKGQALKYQIPDSEKFTNFLLTPTPPSEPQISLDSNTGLLTCGCPANTAFYRNSFTLSYTSKVTGITYSTEFFLEVFSPGASLVPNKDL